MATDSDCPCRFSMPFDGTGCEMSGTMPCHNCICTADLIAAPRPLVQVHAKQPRHLGNPDHVQGADLRRPAPTVVQRKNNNPKKQQLERSASTIWRSCGEERRH